MGLYLDNENMERDPNLNYLNVKFECNMIMFNR